MSPTAYCHICRRGVSLRWVSEQRSHVIKGEIRCPSEARAT